MLCSAVETRTCQIFVDRGPTFVSIACTVFIRCGGFLYCKCNCLFDIIELNGLLTYLLTLVVRSARDLDVDRGMHSVTVSK